MSRFQHHNIRTILLLSCLAIGCGDAELSEPNSQGNTSTSQNTSTMASTSASTSTSSSTSASASTSASSSTTATSTTGTSTMTEAAEISGIEVQEITQTSAKIVWKVGEPVTGQVFFGKTSEYGQSTGGEESFKFTSHAQNLKGLEPGTTYHFQVVSKAQDGREFVSADQTFQTLGEDTKPMPGEGVLFSAIESKGLKNGCYPTVDHHVAEFLFQNPDVCFWEVNEASKQIKALPTPTAPANAVKLPKPSGGDDTQALMRVINANRGKAVVGNGGPYKVNKLRITVPVDIFNLSMVPTSGASDMVIVDADDVRIFNSPIDAKDSSTVTTGFLVSDGADRFVLAKSAFRNSKHTKGENVAGVKIKAASDFHIACNDFRDIINKAPDKGSNKPFADKKTARANAIWMNGGKTKTKPGGPTSGGYIVNNTAENFQSNGKLNDAEFFTTQAYAKTDSKKPVRIFANRGVNAGKRMTKHQESDALVLSNTYEWNVKKGPLGDRSLLSQVTVHFSNNIIARNNRMRVSAQSKFDYVFINSLNVGTKVQDNIHFDCNDIEVRDKLDPKSNSRPYLIVARADGKKGDFTATNSSANNNVARGMGSVRHHYWFGDGYEKKGGKFETKNNQFDIPSVGSEYR